MNHSLHRLTSFGLFSLAIVCGLNGCAAVVGPAYIVEKQEIRVTFEPEPQPRLHVFAEYLLKNSGNQPLESLTIRLPGRAFQPANRTATWDGAALQIQSAEDRPRDSITRFPQSWSVGARHTLRIEYDFASPRDADTSVAVSSEAFALPAEEWSPALPQPAGLFGSGGVPPKKWRLTVQVPGDFLVHASGGKEKRAGKNGSQEFTFPQTAEDLNPFVVAGRYLASRQDLPQKQEIRVWSLQQPDSAAFLLDRDSLSRSLATYETLFGARGNSRDRVRPPLWLVECPPRTPCPSRRNSAYAEILFGKDPPASAQILSQDTIMVRSFATQESDALAEPALAATFLGFGQSPGFYELEPPMSALPAFAIAQAREAAAGPQVRAQIISRAFAQIPVVAPRSASSDPRVLRAKSFLLFYALRDRLGPEAFQRSMRHVLSARRRRGFDVTDLISAAEQESHQPVGPFIRQWMKGPGVPQDFRAKYSQSAVAANSLSQEATQ